MTNYKLTTYDLPTISRFGIGFDRLFDELNRSMEVGQQGYPPYNVVKHSDEAYTIEVAVAGFGENDLNVTVHEGKLHIEGVKEDKVEQDYVYRGLSSRNFTRTFNLAEHVEVKNVTVEQGVMRISLEREVPEEMKPQKLAITFK
jgi:molecular chaperone IbpA